MTCSMTAFARGERPTEYGVLVCEIRSVNHRYLDVSVHMAAPLKALEAGVVKRLREAVARGRVECSFRLQADDIESEFRVDEDSLAALLGEIREVEKQMRSQGFEPALMSPLEVFKRAGTTDSNVPVAANIQGDVIALLDEVLDSLVRSRREEGARLQQFILEHCVELEKAFVRLREHYPDALVAAREKMNAQLAEVDVCVSPERMAQEVALLVQKFCVGADIEEELDRCASHFQELNAIFGRGEPIGRRLDFLTQELHREVNTIASKAIDVETTHAVVDVKTWIERIREQAQNME